MPVLDNITTETTQNTDTLVFSHTCSGGDLSLVVAVFTSNGSVVTPPLTVTSVTYNGVALTFAGREMNGFSSSEYVAEIWYLDAPATGANDVSITLSEAGSGGHDIVGMAASFSGAGSGIGANVETVSDSSDYASISITTEESTSLVLGSIVTQTGSVTFEPGTGVTELADYRPTETPTISCWLGQKDATGGTDTIDATLSVARRHAVVAFELLAAAGGGGGVEGSLSATLGALTAAGEGDLAVEGQAASTLDALSAEASGAANVAGALSAGLAGAMVVASGTAEVGGGTNSTLGALTVAATGTLVIAGVTGVALDDATAEGIGETAVAGALGVELAAVQLAGTGVMGERPIDGALDATLDDVTASAAGVAPVDGQMTTTLDAAAVATAGELHIAGALDDSLGELALESDGVVFVEGALVATLAGVVLVATGGDGVTEPRVLTLWPRGFGGTLRERGQERTLWPRDFALVAEERRP